jgi:hypothetical protein
MGWITTPEIRDQRFVSVIYVVTVTDERREAIYFAFEINESPSRLPHPQFLFAHPLN